MFAGIEPYPAGKQTRVVPIDAGEVLPLYAQNVVLAIVHLLVQVLPVARIVRIDRVNQVLRKCDLDRVVNGKIDIAMVRDVRKRPEGPFLVGPRDIVKVGKPAHGTVLQADQR